MTKSEYARQKEKFEKKFQKQEAARGKLIEKTKREIENGNQKTLGNCKEES